MKNLLLSLVAIATISLTSFGQDLKKVKIDNLEVMTEDLGKMTWDEAMKACADLGDGSWRLPTIDELKTLYDNKDKIGGFTKGPYWSSTKLGTNGAWYRIFSIGSDHFDHRNYKFYARAVRAF